jgi:hypothetical protein
MKRFLCIVALAGCGGTPFADFIGTWQFQSGTNNVACPPPVGASMPALVGNLTLEPAIGADLVSLDNAGCDSQFTVSGTTATAKTGVACERPDPNVGAGVMASSTFTSLTLVTTDGKTMTDTFAGNITFTNTMGSIACTFSGSGSLTKVSNR